MNPLYKNAVIAALLFATIFFAALILYDFLSAIIRQFIYAWEVKQYLKIQSNMEKALLIAKHNQELYIELFDGIRSVEQEQDQTSTTKDK